MEGEVITGEVTTMESENVDMPNSDIIREGSPSACVQSLVSYRTT